MRKLVALLVIGAVGTAGATATAEEARNEAGESKAELALKERKAAPTDAEMDASITLAALLDPYEPGAFSNGKGARVSGTLVSVETEEDGDLHLVLAPSGQETDTRRWVIAEVSPAWAKRDEARRSSRSRRCAASPSRPPAGSTGSPRPSRPIRAGRAGRSIRSRRFASAKAF